jgi:hypothetical protein
MPQTFFAAAARRTSAAVRAMAAGRDTSRPLLDRVDHPERPLRRLLARDVLRLDEARHELRVEAAAEHAGQVEVALPRLGPQVLAVVERAADGVGVAVDDDGVHMELKGGVSVHERITVLASGEAPPAVRPAAVCWCG